MTAPHGIHRPIVLAGVAALLTFVAGFGFMGTWFLLMEPRPTTPAFPDYLSGTIGDGLFLPAIVFGLTLAFAKGGERIGTSGRLLVAMATLLGVGTGSLVQRAWLLDADPKLNWVLPSPHMFSPIGWYHAIFLCVMSGMIFGIFIGLMVKLRRRLQGSMSLVAAQSLGSNGAAALISASCLFVTTAAIDSVRSNPGVATISTLVAVGASLLVPLALSFAIFGSDARNLLRPAGAAATSVVLIVEMLFGPSGANPAFVPWLVAALTTGIALAFVGYEGESIVNSTRLRYFLAPVAFVLAAILTARLPVASWVFVVIFIVVVALTSPIALALSPARGAEIHAITIALIILSVIALGVSVAKFDRGQAEDLKLLNALVSLFVPAIIGSYVAAGVEWFWAPMAAAERRERDDLSRREVLHEIGLAGARAWTTSIGLAIGAFFAVVPFVLLVVDNTVRLVGPGTFDWFLPAVCVLLAALCVVIGRSDIRLAFTNRPDVGEVPEGKVAWSGWRYPVIGSMVTLLAISALAAAVQTGWHGAVSVVVILMVAVVSVDTFETTLLNSSSLCMSPIAYFDVAISACVGFATGAIIYWAVFAGVSSGDLSLGAAILVFIGSLLVRGLLVLVVSSVIYARKGSWYGTDRAPGWNHLQDEGVRALLLLAITWLPAFAYNHSSPSQELINMLIVGGAVLFLAAGFFPFASEGMIRHYDDQCILRFRGRFRPSSESNGSWLVRSIYLVSDMRELKLNNPVVDKEKTFITALGAHLAFQVLIRFALVLLTVVGPIVFILSGLLLKSLAIRPPLPRVDG